MGRGIKIMPLTFTRRCPQTHVAIAQAIVPEFEATDDAPMGTVETIPAKQAVDLIQPGDMVQCRNNAPLAGFVWQLIRRGLKVQIAGRDIGEGLLALIKRMKTDDIPTLIQRVEEYRAKEVDKIGKQRNAEGRMAELNDKCDAIIFLTEGIDTVKELNSFIERIFSDIDDAGEARQAVLLTTTHKAKGLEADNVWILDPSLYPAKWAVQDWEVKQEHNLMYVRDTRSRNRLVYMPVEKKAAGKACKAAGEGDE